MHVLVSLLFMSAAAASGAPAPAARDPETPARARARATAPAPAAGRNDAKMVRHEGTRAWPDTIGPFGLVSKEGQSSLFLGFAGQLIGQYETTDGGDGADREHRFVPMLRRLRITLLGSVLSRSLRYYLQLSFAPGALELMDFWIDWRFTRFTRARIGFQKIGFTRHRMGSFKNRTLVDWSPISPTFGDERQLGLAFHGGQAPEWLDWSVGVFTGINHRSAHALGVAQTYGEPVPNPSALVDPGPTDGFHPELASRLGYRFRDIDLDTDTDWAGGKLRLYAGIGATWDLDAVPTLDHAARLAAELLIKVRGVSLAASGYLSWARRRGGDRLDLRWAMWGLVARSSVLLAGRVELAARYVVIERGRGLLRDARDRADALIAAAPAEEQDALRDRYRLAGRMRREHEATLGVNVYLIGTSLKWQTDVSWLPQRIDGELRHDARVRSQLQLTF